jgi:hypothetical protein
MVWPLYVTKNTGNSHVYLMPDTQPLSKHFSSAETAQGFIYRNQHLIRSKLSDLVNITPIVLGASVGGISEA